MSERRDTPRGDEPIRVLVVDDDPEVADLAGEYLEHSHRRLSVSTETSAVAALARVRESESGFDCIVSDYEMPEMNGLEFHDAVRTAADDVPFILFTVRDEERVAEGRSAITDYLCKDGSAGVYDELADRVTRAAGTAT